MIAVLNNGKQIKIEKSFAQQVFQTIVRDATSTRAWHCNLNPDSGRLIGLNMQEVSCICEEEDIFPETSGALEEIGLFLDAISADDAHGRYWAEKFRRFVLDKKINL